MIVGAERWYEVCAEVEGRRARLDEGVCGGEVA